MRRMIGIFFVFALGLVADSRNASAEWRSDIGVFRIGVVTGDQPSGFNRRAEPFRFALQEALKMDVEFFTARRPESIIDALASDRIEYAILSATGYALAWSVCECIEPLASPKSADGTDGYNLVLIGQRDSSKDLSALVGKNIGLLSSDRTLEVEILKKEIQETGLGADDIKFENKESGEATLEAFLNGDYAALLGWSSLTGDPSSGYTRGTMQIIASRTGDLATKYPIIWKSDQLAHRVHSVRKKLPGEAKNILRNTLVSLYDRNPVAYDSIEPIYGGGFSTSRHSMYQQVINVIQAYQTEEVGGADAQMKNGAPSPEKKDPQQ